MNDTHAGADAPGDAAPAAVPVVRAHSHVTLHYRISLAQTGSDVISTFGQRPATLTLGLGQLVEPLERCLIGLPEGASAAFDLAPEQAFGLRSPELLQRLSRRLLDAHVGAAGPGPGDVVELPAPGGGSCAAVLKEIDEQGALLDFNHPLAGQPIRFEVRILGVL